MTKTEIKAELDRGKRVQHILWDKDDYVYKINDTLFHKNGDILDEDLFWELRSGGAYETNWYILPDSPVTSSEGVENDEELIFIEKYTHAKAIAQKMIKESKSKLSDYEIEFCHLLHFYELLLNSRHTPDTIIEGMNPSIEEINSVITDQKARLSSDLLIKECDEKLRLNTPEKHRNVFYELFKRLRSLTAECQDLRAQVEELKEELNNSLTK